MSPPCIIKNRILQSRILRLRRVAKRQIPFRRSAIHAERILLYRKCDAISYKAKKPHGYHKIAVWQKDDRIWKSPLKFYAQYYSILSGDFQALIITELWRHFLLLLYQQTAVHT